MRSNVVEMGPGVPALRSELRPDCKSLDGALHPGGVMEINGVAHIQLSVSDFEKSRAFYSQLLPAFAMQVQYDQPEVYYCIGGRTGLMITPCAPELRERRFQQGSPGLHHVCFRARSREDVDATFQLLERMGATIVRAPQDGSWAPGYYSLLFEDPDGIRIELNYVPGKGNLDPAVQLQRSRPT